MSGSAAGARIPVHQRLVEPETRYEILDGERVYVAPADEAHALAHGDLAYLLAAHIAPGYRGAMSMLTRTSETSDYATAASVFPAGPDPETGGRQLEEISFDIASDTQPMARAARKARGLIERGVRRSFCLDVGLSKRSRVLEWSCQSGDWAALDPESAIHDRCLVRPLPVAALLDPDMLDDEVARALVAKNNAVIAQIRAEGRAEYIMRTLAARGLDVPDELRARILGCRDLEQLDRWFTRALAAATAADVLD